MHINYNTDQTTLPLELSCLLPQNHMAFAIEQVVNELEDRHFQEKQADQFFELTQEALPVVNPIFQTVFKTFLKDKEKIVNTMELPHSNAKLEATNNLDYGH